MSYLAKDFTNLQGIDFLSENLLINHFTLYQGYVTNTNKLSDSLKGMELDNKTATPEYAELRRRFGWEWNGMRLHELYFENLSKSTTEPSDKLLEVITTEFGSLENWLAGFKATAAMRGIGWVILYYDDVNKRLFNQWINEHDVAHLAGLKPLLVFDVFEHSFMLDYGLKRADYIAAFMARIDWVVVEARM